MQGAKQLPKIYESDLILKVGAETAPEQVIDWYKRVPEEWQAVSEADTRT